MILDYKRGALIKNIHDNWTWAYYISFIVVLMNFMECKQTMYVGRLCRLKYGLLWVPINTFPFAQILSNLARCIVRCYLTICEILMLMRQKLRKMLFFIFIFQIEEQILYFFPSRIRYGVFNVYNLKKKHIFRNSNRIDIKI